MARRCILERNYDLVVINSPVPDESGEAFALFVTEQSNASVLLVTPHDLHEQVMDRLTDYGILVMAKPFPYGQINKAIRFLTAVQNRMGSLAKQTQTLEEKMEEIRIISRAKLLLVEKKGMTEDAAHRFIGKQAMDQGVSRRRIAQKLIRSLGKD
jgi:response regulator NasT